jgi:hypothetical protein
VPEAFGAVEGADRFPRQRGPQVDSGAWRHRRFIAIDLPAMIGDLGDRLRTGKPISCSLSMARPRVVVAVESEGESNDLPASPILIASPLDNPTVRLAATAADASIRYVKHWRIASGCEPTGALSLKG